MTEQENEFRIEMLPFYDDIVNLNDALKDIESID